MKKKTPGKGEVEKTTINSVSQINVTKSNNLVKEKERKYQSKSKHKQRQKEKKKETKRKSNKDDWKFHNDLNDKFVCKKRNEEQQ